MTKGFKSTELWITVAAVLMGAYLALEGVDATTIGAVVSPIMAYALSRGVAKHGNGA